MPNNETLNEEFKPAQEEYEITSAEPKKLKKYLKKFAYLSVFFTIILFLLFAKASPLKQGSTPWYNRIPLVSQIKYFASGSDKPLKGEENDRINILLLGIGGKNHDGGNLTDTIILASLQPSTKKVSLVSIPRDMTIPMENMGWRKVNNVNAYAEMKNPGSGGIATCQAISDILDMPIDYYVRVDFQGFINIIDKLGGVTVDVENSFDDYKYPVLGNEDAQPYSSRYEHLHFDTGLQEMDGSTALKYARSRHAYGAEGSDFARAKRQQKILSAAKEKLLSANILFKPQLLIDIIGELQDHVSTNLQMWEIIKLWGEFKDVKQEDIINKGLDNSSSGLLINTVGEDGAYILVPRNGDFSEIQYLVKNIFSSAPAEIKSKVAVEKTTIDVRNGTWINGIANKVSMDLEKYGFDVVRVGNCSRQDFQNSVIYDLTYGEKTESLSVLKEKTKANVSLDLPQWLADDLKAEAGSGTPAKPDFILILGRDADSTSSGAANTAN